MNGTGSQDDHNMIHKFNRNLTIANSISHVMKCFLIFCTVIFCAGCGNKERADDGLNGSIDIGTDEDASPDRDICSCVRIYTKSECSTGFIIRKDEESIVIVASLHGLDSYGEDSQIVFFDGSASFGQVFGSNEELDAGFVEIAAGDVDSDTFMKLAPVVLPDTDQYTGSMTDKGSTVDITKIYSYDLYAAGSLKDALKYERFEGELISADEYIYDYDRNMLFGRLDRVNDGMSGSPVFNADGECLGMIVAGNDDGSFAGVFIRDILNLISLP